MIREDLMEWIIQTLDREKDMLCEYSYEYITALFMNLSLRTTGKIKCEEMPQVIEILSEFLNHQNIQVRTFINGSLYSLFSRSKLKQRALDLGINEYLLQIIDEEDERIKKQIEYILEQLERP